ncbi:N-acetylglucosamine kinase [uncultured Anaerococcus sp.]|uniref:N-acetylglucosamine kinase n=1 Tax=uncultured Anaerococcus sp. TaxID=293428 RepID=UPI0026249F4F|nr:BadF/BadG/BcrA/BcrD ATPase family protein [uncultured Anaerococcus sp.]
MINNSFLGVDGGGTKTEFLLDINGNKFNSKQKTIHPKQVSKQEYFNIMESGVKDVVNKAGIKAYEIDYSFIAVPGYGQYPDTEEYIDKGIRKVLQNDRFRIGNDCVNGWAGSLNGNPGVNIVLGTGAIGYGVDDKGNSIRCSGWGPLIGDEASGYWIGLKLLNIFTKMSDGRIEKDLIYDLVKEKLDIKYDFEIFEIVENMERDEIASLSVILDKALELNNQNALIILDEISDEVTLVINTIIKKLDFNSTIKVSFSGGVVNLGEKLIQSIDDKVGDNIELVKPFASPVEGSVILAKKLYKENRG